MWFRTASVTSSRTPSLCNPVATVRRKSCTFHHGSGAGGLTHFNSFSTADMIALLSAILTFDHRAKGSAAATGLILVNALKFVLECLRPPALIPQKLPKIGLLKAPISA